MARSKGQRGAIHRGRGVNMLTAQKNAEMEGFTLYPIKGGIALY